jgi:hypothetical protein
MATFEGALICKLQREDVKPEDQSKSTHILFLVAWKFEGYGKFLAFVQLMECDKTFRWDEIEPEEYYQRYANQLCTYTDHIRNTWLIHDNMVLMTRLELDFTQRDSILNISVSEGVNDEHIRRPEQVDPKM